MTKFAVGLAGGVVCVHTAMLRLESAADTYVSRWDKDKNFSNGGC